MNNPLFFNISNYSSPPEPPLSYKHAGKGKCTRAIPSFYDPLFIRTNGNVGIGTTAPTYNTTTNCYLDNLRLTCSKINFESSEYYDLKAQKLLTDGL